MAFGSIDFLKNGVAFRSFPVTTLFKIIREDFFNGFVSVFFHLVQVDLNRFKQNLRKGIKNNV